VVYGLWYNWIWAPTRWSFLSSRGKTGYLRNCIAGLFVLSSHGFMYLCIYTFVDEGARMCVRLCSYTLVSLYSYLLVSLCSYILIVVLSDSLVLLCGYALLGLCGCGVVWLCALMVYSMYRGGLTLAHTGAFYSRALHSFLVYCALCAASLWVYKTKPIAP